VTWRENTNAHQDHGRCPGSLDHVSAGEASPTEVEVLHFEDRPLGSRGSRRAVVRWSDCTEDEALSWFADEILVLKAIMATSAYVFSG
jgi:hypothetical protein